MVFHLSISDSKFPQVSRTLLSIPANLNDSVIWMVSTCPLISTSSSPFTYPLEIVPSTPSPSCSIVFTVLKQDPDIDPSFYILLILFCYLSGR